MATKIKYEISENIATLTFFDEEGRKPCALDWDVLSDMEKALDDIAKKTDEVRAVIVQSASEKSFIVGANIEVLKTVDAKKMGDWCRNGHRIFGKLQALPVPTIAKVESYALGGGLELAMACDMIIATENGKFAQPEAGLGVMPGWGGTYRLAKLIGPNRAKEMFYTGQIIDSKRAYKYGLVNHVYNSDVIDEKIKELTDKIIKNDAQVLALTKEIINFEWEDGMKRNAYDEAITSEVCMNSESTQKRLNDFFESRKKK